jgi:hypothetical protein
MRMILYGILYVILYGNLVCPPVPARRDNTRLLAKPVLQAAVRVSYAGQAPVLCCPR